MENETIPTGSICDIGVLNLLSAKTEEDLNGILNMCDIGLILVPEHLCTAIAKIPMCDIGAVVPVPQGDKLTLIAGQTRLTGEALAAGDSGTVLFVAGELMITTVVHQVGYKAIQVAGQIQAPRGSETALMGALSSVMGTVKYYPDGARMFSGSETIGEEFLKLLPKPCAIMFSGHLRLDSDVTAETLQAKVTEFSYSGTLEVPRRLAALAQVLTSDKSGELQITD